MSCVCLSFNLEGAHFVIVPTVYCKIFGPDDGIRVFSVGFSFIGLASLFNIFVINNFLDAIGFSGMCYLYTWLSVLAGLVLIILHK